MKKSVFALAMIAEIKAVLEAGFAFQSVILIANYNEFARLELGINIFADRKINRALAQCLIGYAPSNLIAIDENPKRHMKKQKGQLIICPKVLILSIEDSVKANIKKIDKVDYLTITAPKGKKK